LKLQLTRPYPLRRYRHDNPLAETGADDEGWMLDFS
jgi:hypothetical protein